MNPVLELDSTEPQYDLEPKERQTLPMSRPTSTGSEYEYVQEHEYAALVSLVTGENLHFTVDNLVDVSLMPLSDLERKALETALNPPPASIDLPGAPELSGNLVLDVMTLCDLGRSDIERLFGISEADLNKWERGDVPEQAETQLRAVHALALTLSGGLMPRGRKKWIFAGSPSRWERIQSGDVEGVINDVDTLRSTIVT